MARHYRGKGANQDSVKNILELTRHFPKSLRITILIFAAIAMTFIVVGFGGFFALLIRSMLAFPEETTSPKMFAIFFGMAVVGVVLTLALTALSTVLGLKYSAKTSQRRSTKHSYFPQIQQVQDQELRRALIAAVKKLNINDVDMGLLHLGKIFESELTELISVAQRAGAFPVTSRDTKRLVDKIRWLERNEIPIVVDTEMLDFLRKQRNRHAHGKILTYAERKALLKHAPYLADLFIDVILPIHKYRLWLALRHDPELSS